MGLIGRGSWATYLDRAVGKAQLAMQQLIYSVSGRCPLQLATSVHLFKALVVLEYGDAIWGAMCSKTRLRELESVQELFARRLLRVRSTVAGEFVRRELGLESMGERLLIAVLRFYGRLSKMPDSRLAGFIFRPKLTRVELG